MTLDKEAFKRWLAKQPDDREFNYMDIFGCLFSSFAREELGWEKVHGNGSRISGNNNEDVLVLPAPFADAAAFAACSGRYYCVFTIAAFKAELARQLHKEGV
jgi:hypothetical protein